MHVKVDARLHYRYDQDTYNKKAVLSQGGPRAAAVTSDTYESLQRHRAIVTAIARLSN